MSNTWQEWQAKQLAWKARQERNVLRDRKYRRILAVLMGAMSLSGGAAAITFIAMLHIPGNFLPVVLGWTVGAFFVSFLGYIGTAVKWAIGQSED